jgi:hypothetical protein
MAKKQTVTADENVRQFKDLTDKSWILENDGKQIKVGDNVANLISGDCQTLEVSEILHGEPWKTWRIAINAVDNSFILLKTAKQVK